MRVSLSKNESLVFNKFIRKYKEALDKFAVAELMDLCQVQRVLAYLGFID